MALNDLWRKFIRDNDDDEFGESVQLYQPNRKPAAAPAVDEPDNDFFTSTSSTTARRPQGRPTDDYDELDEEDPDTVAAPRIKQISATGLGSADRVVELIKRNFVVLVNTENVPDELLTNFQCYLAGAIRALDATTTPIDDFNVFISIVPFDATPFLPNDEQDELEEQEDDLI